VSSGFPMGWGKVGHLENRPVPEPVGAELVSAPDRGKHKVCPYNKSGFQNTSDKLRSGWAMG